MKTKLLILDLFVTHLTCCFCATTESMRSYTIQFPNHTLRYALPNSVVKSMPPFVQVKQLSRFDPADKSFIKNEFFQIAGTLHDFNGPFWVGAYGSFEFNVTVVKR